MKQRTGRHGNAMAKEVFLAGFFALQRREEKKRGKMARFEFIQPALMDLDVAFFSPFHHGWSCCVCLSVVEDVACCYGHAKKRQNRDMNKHTSGREMLKKPCACEANFEVRPNTAPIAIMMGPLQLLLYNRKLCPPSIHLLFYFISLVHLNSILPATPEAE